MSDRSARVQDPLRYPVRVDEDGPSCGLSDRHSEGKNVTLARVLLDSEIARITFMLPVRLFLLPLSNGILM